MSQLILGNHSFVEGAQLSDPKGLVVAATNSKGRVKLISCDFQCPKSIVAGEYVEVVNGSFSGDVHLTEGATLLTCSIEGNLYVDEKSARKFIDCFVKGRLYQVNDLLLKAEKPSKRYRKAQ